MNSETHRLGIQLLKSIDAKKRIPEGLVVDLKRELELDYLYKLIEEAEKYFAYVGQ